MPTSVIVLGATGSIGRQTLDCLRAAAKSEPGRFEIKALTAHHNFESLREAGREWPGATLVLSGAAGQGAPSISPIEQLLRTTDADLVVNGISGAAGLSASVVALESGKNLALANKESVVMAWGLLADRAKRYGRKIIPVDSEHAALFQLTGRIGTGSIDELFITASGGPFRDRDPATLFSVTPDEAAKHPTWKMGRKISIDSATLANKGLELIEAVRFFSIRPEQIRVLVHPESIVHALVRTIDGALYAHLSEADMHLPIDVALHWPEERPCPFGRLDLAGKTLHFADPDPLRFPMLGLARAAVTSGEGFTIAYNAANEIAVEAFEAGKIRFTQIAELVERTLDYGWNSPEIDLGAILESDSAARTRARTVLSEMR
ncbi:MAG: 1-deoxy-D-xylulose-5-phosphate reductoisomerase [Rectinemataceae bacterium]